MIYGNPIGSIFAQGIQTSLWVPSSIIIYILATSGALLPFFAYGIWKGLKEKNKFIMFLIAFVVVVLPVHNLWAEGLRYFTAFTFIFALISAYKIGKKLIYIFVALCFVNAAVGGYIVYNYAYPSQKTDIFLKIATFTDYYNEHIDYKNAALVLKNITTENETVITDSYAFVWYYSHRAFVDIPQNETEFQRLVKEKNIRYAYIHSNNIEFIKKYNIIFNRDFAKIYNITVS